MELLYIQVKSGTAFIVLSKKDKLREKNNILFGKCMVLKCTNTLTDKLPTGVKEYSNFVSEKPIQVCKKESITVQRSASTMEQSIFENVKKHISLDKQQRKYLRNNFYKVIDQREKN